MSFSAPDLIVDTAMRDDPELAIAASGLGKCYRMFDNPSARLKQALLRRDCGRSFWALRDVSFTVRRGEALGVVGHNGAGKSTLLQILAGSLKPTTGEARLRGRVTSLLELGSGFLPDFTGRENVFVNGTALGLSTKELKRRMDEIQAFAEIDDFFDQPVKIYSSGMYVRLAFAVQACLDPDILIVDEALAVGDIFFQQKCHAHMETLLKRGVAILLVTHDVQAVRKYCSQALLLNGGHVVHQGDIEAGLRLYFNRLSGNARQDVANPASPEPDADAVRQLDVAGVALSHWPCAEAFFDLSLAHTTEKEPGAVRLAAMGLCDAAGNPCRSFGQDQKAFFYIEINTLRDLQQLVVGITLWTRDNLPVYCQNTLQANAAILRTTRKNAAIRLCWVIDLPLARGDYTVTLDLAEYPSWIMDRMETIPPESFFQFGTPLVSVLRIGFFNIVEPVQGMKLPFLGLVGLETRIEAQYLS